MARIRNRVSLLVSVVVVSLMFFAAFAAISYAADGDSLQNATKLDEVTGPQYPTFTAPLFAYTPYTGAHFGQYWFVFNLDKGETITADFTWGPTVSGLTATVLATAQTPQTSSTALSDTVQRLVFSSPVDDGAYVIQVVTGSGVGDTFSITPTISTSAFSITPSAGANGSISPNVAQAVTYGGSQQFTFTPDTGYQVADVKVDNVSVAIPRATRSTT